MRKFVFQFQVVIAIILIVPVICHGQAAQETDKKSDSALKLALEAAGDNRAELEKSLQQVSEKQKPALKFLIENMPVRDLKSLKADFLLEHVRLAYQARGEFPWGKKISDEMFFNDVVAYANVNEKREAWRDELYKICKPIVKDCKTAAEAAHKINQQLFRIVKVKYSTKRKRPDQAPSESIEQGMASCTGLSILLSDACRSVSIPARLTGTPLWTNKRGNHTWVEIWDGVWHFTGACEASKQGLNHGWFVGDASRAIKDSRLHAIYSTSFRKTKTTFPLVWARRDKSVYAVNVTERYNAFAKPKSDKVRLFIRVLDSDGKTRVARKVKVTDLKTKKTVRGLSKDERFDTNDFLTIKATKGVEYKIELADGKQSQTVKIGDQPQTVTIILK